MARWLLYILAAFGLLALVAAAAIVILLQTGVVTPEKLRLLAQYNPIATANQAPIATSRIQTGLMPLKRRDVSLPPLGDGFVSGGGAFVELPNGLLVAERSGQFHFVQPDQEPPTVRKTAIAIEINQAGFDAYALANGYELKPGRSVGYAGLAMRLHDLLLLRDGKRLMASFTRWNDAKNCASLHIAITTLDLARATPAAGPWRDLYRTQPCLGLSTRKSKPFAGHQAGGRMIELPDGKVLFTVGDFKNDGEKRDLSTGDRDNDYGKTHLLDLETGAVARNYTVGHRNPQGLVQLQNGEIWSTEHGPSGGDEINRIDRGGDYGWPFATLGLGCGGCDWLIEGRQDGYVQPRWAFIPSIGISNLIEIRNFAPRWDGDLLVMSLYAETLFRIRLDDGRPMYAEAIKIGHRMRDIAQLADNRIVLWTDTGRLIFLTPDLAPAKADILAKALSPAAQAVVGDCSVCHVLQDGAPPEGRIPLWGVFGRDVASTPGADYSDALRQMGGRWTRPALDRYLENPAAAVPGTTMPYEGVTDPELRREVIDFLEALRYEG